MKNIVNIFKVIFSNYLDLPLLLRYEENEEPNNWIETILKELGDYIRNTGRLTSKVAENDISR